MTETTETSVSSPSRGTRRDVAVVVVRAEWDRLLAAALGVVSVVLLLVTYRQVARTPFVADQLSYLASGGIGALLAAAAAITLFVSTDHHDEWRKLDGIEEALGRRQHQRANDGVDGRRSAGPTPGTLASPRSRDVLVTGAAFVVAAGLGVGGWRSAATTADVGDAAAGLRTAVLAVLLSAAACIAYTAVARQRLLARRGLLLDRFLVLDAALAVTVPDGGAQASSDAVFTAPGLTRYHRAGCPSLGGVHPAPIDVGTATRSLESCELCLDGHR